MSEHRDELLPQFGVLLLTGQFFLLRQLSFADVDSGADHPFASASLVEYSTAFGGNPADDSVFLANRAVFHIIKFAAGRIGRAGIGSGDTIAVIRVQPVVKIVHADGCIGGYAEHRLHARRPGQSAMALLDIPPSDVGGFGRQPESFLGGKQLGRNLQAFRLSFLSFGYVLMNTNQTYWMARLVAFDLADSRDPAYLAS